MGVLRGEDGELKYQGNRVAKVRDWSINTVRDVIDVTTLGSTTREYVGSLVSANGSANIIYDYEDPATVSLVQSYFDGDKSDPIDMTLVISKRFNKNINVQVVITSGSLSNTVAEVVSSSISFQVSGQVGVEL